MLTALSNESSCKTFNDDDFGEVQVFDLRCHANNSANDARRYARNRKLPNSLRVADWRKIRFDDFGERCALTNKRSPDVYIRLGHFIALNTGHGGTFIGNIFPIEASWNTSMGDRNPFEVYKYIPDNNNQQLFNKLVQYLASQNKLSVVDFKEYVDWCYKNPINQFNRRNFLVSYYNNKVNELDSWHDRQGYSYSDLWSQVTVNSLELWKRGLSW